MKRFRLLTITLATLLASGLAACGAGAPQTTPTPAGDPVAGQAAYQTTCIACHGPAAEGVPGLGKDLTTSDWVASQSDADLLAMFKTGRPAADPLNTTGIDMPPKGGNPALTDDDLQNIVAYLRSIHK